MTRAVLLLFSQAGTWYLVADMSVECYSEQWHRALPFAIVLIVVFVLGIPCATLAVLYKHRFAIFGVETPPSATFWLGRSTLDHKTAYARFGSLVAGYEPKYAPCLCTELGLCHAVLTSIVRRAELSAPFTPPGTTTPACWI